MMGATMYHPGETAPTFVEDADKMNTGLFPDMKKIREEFGLPTPKDPLKTGFGIDFLAGNS